MRGFTKLRLRRRHAASLRVSSSTQECSEPARGVPRRWLVAIAAIVTLVLTLGAFAATGPVGTAAGFEDDDANLVDNAGNALIDWNSFKPAVWTGTAPYRQSSKEALGWQFRGIEDDGDSITDTAFAGGTKQDDDCA